MGSISNANSSLVITPRLAGALSGLLPALAGAGINVQGYSSDDAFATEAVDIAETHIGVDGLMSAGYLPRLNKMSITLSPDSITLPVFNALVGVQDQIKELILLDGILTLQSINTTFALINGVMSRITPIPPGKKVLNPVSYELTWWQITPAPMV